MRDDMTKVIIDRPRFGHRDPSRKKGYRKYVQQTGLEQLPQRETMLGRWRGKGRYFNDHLAPLWRFLQSRVGRPWNRVYQEICQHVSLNSVVQKHLLTHVDRMVAIRVEVSEDGALAWGPDERRQYPLRPGDFYVCPRTGILKRFPRQRGETLLQEIDRGQTKQYRLRDGQWWELRLQKRPATSVDRYDLWLDRPLKQLTDHQLTAAYGAALTAVSSRPLSPRETRELHRRIRKEGLRQAQRKSKR